MEYKVSYQNKEYNLNAVLSFDLLKEVLFKLLVSQENLEKEIDIIKDSNKKRDKNFSKLEKLIKDNIGFDEEYSNENAELDLTEEEREDEENKDLSETQNEKSPQKKGWSIPIELLGRFLLIRAKKILLRIPSRVCTAKRTKREE